MPRHGRFVVVGHPQHVISRGSNRQAIFCCNKDCSFYLDKASKLQRIQWQNSSFSDWAEESIELRQQVYDFGDAKNEKIIPLGCWYQSKNRVIAERRLQQAGVRLAYHLNQLFAK